MLRINSITLNNFGPYKGTQTIDLSVDDSGVVVVYGENMRGKTSLLNAIRYAFFGYVTGRGEHNIDLSKVGNWEAAEEGQFGFKVVLSFDYKGITYELTRACVLRPGVSTPSASTDYAEERLIRRGASVLGPDERDRILAEVLPETVSRFFLFDGELLQQYEELLRVESDMGKNIKDAIERILGMPVLTNARSDLREATIDAQRLEARAAQKDQKTQELGNNHQQLLERRQHLAEELARMAQDRDALVAKKASTDEQMRTTARLGKLLNERDALLSGIADIDRRISEKRARAAELMSDSWRWLLSPLVTDRANAIRDEANRLQNEVTRLEMLSQSIVSLERAVSGDKCDSCFRILDEGSRSLILERIEAMRQEVSSATQPQELGSLLHRASQLASVAGIDRSDIRQQVLNDIDDLRMERVMKKDRVAVVEDQTKELDEGAIRRLQSEHEKTVQELALLEQGMRAQQAVLDETQASILKVQAQLDKVGGSALSKERRKRETCEQLQHLFEASVSEYRDRLRKKVEADASSLFTELTTEPEYTSLRINESYGLTIQHKDGGDIPVRSAGAEHIVALSLMGALQRNAPLRGPIIMDSPFGRLDDNHTSRVVRTLPKMASQVLLLVYEAEMGPSLAREEMKNSLKREYRLTRRSARHTDITAYTE
jgi:DNA sulfur modification protein DndD